MGNLFKYDGGIFTFLGKMFDLFVLSILWTICSIPLITIGLSTTALYYAVVKVVRRDRGYLLKEFFHAVKTNLKQGMVLGILCFGLWALLYFNVQLTKRVPDPNSGTLMFYGYMAIGLLALFAAMYLFPLLSRFTMTVLQYLQTAVVLCFKHFPSTIVMGIIIIVAIVLMRYLPVLVLIAPGAACYVLSFFMERILKKYTPKTEEGDERKDEWYLE